MMRYLNLSGSSESRNPALFSAWGYIRKGIAGSFVVKLVGSYSAVVGLPLNETADLLAGEGYPVHFNWLNQSTLTVV